MKKLTYPLLYLLAITFVACTKDIEVKLPAVEQQIVVEGSIEQGSFPLIILTRSQGYYDPINAGTFSNLFVSGAKVQIVVNEKDTVLLDQLCSADLPDSLKGAAAELLNLPIENSLVNICIYFSADSRLLGKKGNQYELLVDADGKKLKSTTFIPNPIPLDSLYFKVDGNMDSLGFIYASVKDPAVDRNNYRWFAQRINPYNYGKNKGEMKDAQYIAPFGSVFNDEFVDGQKIEFGFNRGRISGSEEEDDLNIERGYYKRGDTIAVKFTSIDKGVYEYYLTYYNSLGNSGSPFATPANVKSNVSGGLGIWAGYGVYLDTLVVK